MKIIEKIEIKSFRSFGNRKRNKTQISKISDLNIFSGANDSGKSNILRALNLFFNQRTNLVDFLNFNNDFFKRENPDKDDIAEAMITVKISFFNEKNKGKNEENNFVRLPGKFWVSRKWLINSEFSAYNQADGVETSFKKEKKDKWKTYYADGKKLKQNFQASLSRQLSGFLESIQFHYIPAIKDKGYFSHLYGELQQTLLKEENSSVNKNKSSFQKSIQDSTEDLMSEFKNVVNDKNLNLSAAFELPDLINLFRTLNVQTGKVDLQYRGDGVQAKLIPEILNFIATKELLIKKSKVKKGEKTKKYFIWGFEEPENSYEYKNAQILAERFKDLFIKKAQIFITTHSFNFLSIEGPNVSTYRVWKDNVIESSRVTKVKVDKNGTFDFEGNDLSNELDKLNDELGVFALNKKLLAIFTENEKLRESLNHAIEEYKKYEKILLVEDKYDQIYKITWLIIHNIDCDESNFNSKFSDHCGFHIQGQEGAGAVAGFLRANNIDLHKNQKIIGLWDFDKEGSENFYHCRKTDLWDENIYGQMENGFYIKRKSHNGFYGMLLPVPSDLKSFASIKHDNFANYIEIENLLPIKFLTKNNFVDSKEIVGQKYYKIKENKKSVLWKSLFELKKEDLGNFVMLFDQVKNLFDKS